MARDHARVMCAIWRDAEFVRLSASAQRAYMLLLSQPKLSLCGAIDYTPARWADLADDTTADDVAAAIDELEERSFVIVDHGTQEVLLRSFVRHDGVLESPNLIQAMWKAWVALYSERLRAAIIAELPDKAFAAGFGSTKNYEPPPEALALRAGEGSPKGSPKPSVKGSSTPVPAPDPGTNSPRASASTKLAAAGVESSPLATERDDLFEKAWEHYPRKLNKAGARKAWRTRVKAGSDPEDLALAAENYAERCQRDGTEERFILHGSTFFGPNDRWRDFLKSQASEGVNPHMATRCVSLL